MLWVGQRGKQNSTLCMLVKILKIMDDSLPTSYTHAQNALTFSVSKYSRNANKPHHNRKTPIPSKRLTASIRFKLIWSFKQKLTLLYNN